MGVHVVDAQHATLTVTGDAAFVLALHATVTDLTETLVPPDATGPDGTRLRVAEREPAGLRLALRAVTTTGALPDASPTTTTTTPPRRRELGVVRHADTLLGDGPAAHDPGQVRSTGRPLPVPAQHARHHAHQALAEGAGTTLLLADDHGRLLRLVRIGAAPAGGWSRTTMLTAGRRALAGAGSSDPLPQSRSHDPTRAIDEHVRAAHPASCAPGTGASTGSGSRRVDLDHVVPWPHGPTTPANLRPLHRAPHRRKTRGLWHTRLRQDGSVQWTTLTGATWTHTDEPLPGYLTGEGYAPAI